MKRRRAIKFALHMLYRAIFRKGPVLTYSIACGFRGPDNEAECIGLPGYEASMLAKKFGASVIRSYFDSIFTDQGLVYTPARAMALWKRLSPEPRAGVSEFFRANEHYTDHVDDALAALAQQGAPGAEEYLFFMRREVYAVAPSRGTAQWVIGGGAK